MAEETEVAQGERPSAEVVVTLSIDSIPPSSFRAVASAVVTVTVRIVCERVEKSPREMTMTVLQLLLQVCEAMYSRPQERFLDSSKL